ncbi:hypothetical protein QTP88_019876 [Uroleucon formosanum]
MSINKVKAIGYPLAAVFDANDQKSFRMLILWLEENVLHTYVPEKLTELQNVDSPSWDIAFKNYCVSCSSPIKTNEAMDQLEWLLGLAIRLTYNKQKNKFDSETKKTLEVATDIPMIIPSDNPIDNLDVNSSDFKEGIEKLADLLNISKHPDHKITLEAIHKFIIKRLNEEVINNPSSILPKGEAFPLEKVKGHKIESKDSAVLHAMKVLRLAQLHRLRDLQTCINECIVAMQEVTSDPKTDTKLGKVGY